MNTGETGPEHMPERASETRRAYAFAWGAFLRYCAQQKAEHPSLNFDPLPASARTVERYVAHLAYERKTSYSFVKMTLAAIDARHAELGAEAPSDRRLKAALAAVRAHLKKTRPARGKLALRRSEIDSAAAHMTRRGDPLRDRALLLLGFASGMRRSELARLRIEDVRPSGEGLRISASPQSASTGLIFVARKPESTTCPVAAYERWITHANIRDGYVFRRRYRGGSYAALPITGATVAEIIKSSAALIGFDPASIGGQSLRTRRLFGGDRGHITAQFEGD